MRRSGQRKKTRAKRILAALGLLAALLMLLIVFRSVLQSPAHSLLSNSAVRKPSPRSAGQPLPAGRHPSAPASAETPSSPAPQRPWADPSKANSSAALTETPRSSPAPPQAAALPAAAHPADAFADRRDAGPGSGSPAARQLLYPTGPLMGGGPGFALVYPYGGNQAAVLSRNSEPPAQQPPTASGRTPSRDFTTSPPSPPSPDLPLLPGSKGSESAATGGGPGPPGARPPAPAISDPIRTGGGTGHGSSSANHQSSRPVTESIIVTVPDSTPDSGLPGTDPIYRPPLDGGADEPFAAVPEPGSFVLLATSIAAVAGIEWRRRRASSRTK